MVEVGLQFLISNEGEFKAQLRSMAESISSAFSKGGFGGGQSTVDANNAVNNVKKVKGAHNELTQQINDNSQVWKNLGQSMLFAGSGTYSAYLMFQKLRQGIKDTVEEGATFEQKLADLQALSGMTSDDLKTISGEATKMSKAFGIDAVEVLDSYTRAVNVMGLALGQNAPLLAEFGKQILLLSKSNANITPDVAAGSLTTMFNQFGGDIRSPKAGQLFSRLANVIAAGSREANAQPGDIAQAIKVAGPIVASSKITPEDAMASLEVLSQFNIKGEQAGTMLRNLLIRMSSGTKQANDELAKYGATFEQINPQIVGFVGGIERLKEVWQSIKDPVAASEFSRVFFGIRAQAGGQILMQNIDKMKGMSSEMSGTNMAEEQSNIRMNTLQTHISKGKADVAAEIRSLYDETKPEIDSLIMAFFGLFRDGIAGTRRFIADTKKLIKDVHDAIQSFIVDINNYVGAGIRYWTDQWGLTKNAFGKFVSGVAGGKNTIVNNNPPPPAGTPGPPAINSNTPPSPFDKYFKPKLDSGPTLIKTEKVVIQSNSVDDGEHPFGSDFDANGIPIQKHAKGGIARKPIFAIHSAAEEADEVIAPLDTLLPMMVEAINQHENKKGSSSNDRGLIKLLSAQNDTPPSDNSDDHASKVGETIAHTLLEHLKASQGQGGKFDPKKLFGGIAHTILGLFPGGGILSDFLSLIPGFKSGGFTGNQPMGIVHAKEFVSDAETTRNARPILEFLHMTKGKAKGYSGGGFVSDFPNYFFQQQAPSMSAFSGGSQYGGDISQLVSHLKRVESAVRTQKTVILDNYQRKVGDIADDNFRASHRW